MAHDKSWLIQYKKVEKPIMIAVAKTGMTVESIGYGVFQVNFETSETHFKHDRSGV